MSKIAVNSTLNISFYFTYQDTYVNPDTLSGELYLYDENAGAFPGTPTSTFGVDYLSDGLYEYVWTPAVEGKYKITLLGEFASIPDILHEKYFLIGDIEPDNTLDSSWLVTMLGQLDPLYLDPEYVLQFYPDGDLTEITEIIHRKSLELESKVGCDPILEVTALQSDFILAATLCELSRIYGVVNGGLTGFSGADSFKLGDLEVANDGAGGRLASGKYDTGNADSWCELAMALKAQLSSAKDAMRSVVPGSDYLSPIPQRSLKSSDL